MPQQGSSDDSQWVQMLETLVAGWQVQVAVSLGQLSGGSDLLENVGTRSESAAQENAGDRQV